MTSAQSAVQTSLRCQRLPAATCLALFALASLAASSTSLAATNTFVAGTSWNTPSDWSLGHVPATTDALLFNHSAFGTEPTTTLDGSFSVQTLSLDTGADNFNINANASAYDYTPRTLTLTGGTNALGTGDLIATSGTTTGTVILGGLRGGTNLRLVLAASGTISVANAAANLALGADISGSNGLTKTGAGTLTLAGTNTYTGTTTVSAGTLIFSQPGYSTLGGAINVGAGAALAISAGTVDIGSHDLTLDGTAASPARFTANYGLLNTNYGSLSTGATYVGVNGSASMVFGGLTHTASGGLFLAVNAGSTGSYTLKDATLVTSGVIGGSGTSTFNFDGGIVQATRDSAGLFQGVSAINVQAGGAGIDTAGFQVTAAQPLRHDPALGSASDGGLTKSGAGMLTLNVANTYTGPTTVNQGTLRLDFSAGGSPVGNIVSPSSVLTLNGGTLALQGSNTAGSNSSQSFNGLTLGTGASTVSVTSGSGGATSVSLGAISRDPAASYSGGTLDFLLPANGTINATGAAGAILSSHGVAFATVGGSDWAALDGTGTRIVGGSTVSGFYTPSTAGALSGNADIAPGVTATSLSGAATTLSSLRFNQAQATTVSVGDGNTLTPGGILVTPAVGSSGSQISGGTLTSPDGQDLVIIQNNPAGELRINSVIADSTSSTSLTKSGVGALTLTGANTYTGDTTVNAGTLNILGAIHSPESNLIVSGLTAGPASVTLVSGGAVSTYNTVVGGTYYNSSSDTVGTDNGSGTFIQSGGTHTTGYLDVAYNPGSTGSYTLGGGTLSAREADVGDGGNGTFIQNGGLLSTGTTYVGIDGTGTFIQNGGTHTVRGDLHLGDDSGSTGSYTLRDGTLTVGTGTYGGDTYVGYDGSGTFLQSGGNHIVGDLELGYDTGSQGSYTLSGGTLATESTYVGDRSNGTFVQSGGTHTVDYDLRIGNGNYTLSGGTLITGITYVSDDANTSVFTQSGGTHTTGQLVLANYSTSTNGTYHLDGGVLTTGSVVGGIGTSVFHFNGGTLQAGADDPANGAFFSGVGTVTVQAGGAVIDSNGFGVTVASNLVTDPGLNGAADGGLTKLGAGSLRLTGANTYTGPTAVNGGTLVVNGSLGGRGMVTVASSATLAGRGTVAGAVTVQAGGTFAPGELGVGRLTLGGGLTLSGAATAAFTLGGTAAGTQYAQAQIAGQVTLGVSATLSLSLSGGYTPALGAKFYLLDETGTQTMISGVFANAPLSGAVFASNGVFYQINYLDHDPADTSNALFNDVSVTVVPEPSTWALMGLGGTGLVSLAWRRRVARG